MDAAIVMILLALAWTLLQPASRSQDDDSEGSEKEIDLE